MESRYKQLSIEDQVEIFDDEYLNILSANGVCGQALDTALESYTSLSACQRIEYVSNLTHSLSEEPMKSSDVSARKQKDLNRKNNLKLYRPHG